MTVTIKLDFKTMLRWFFGLLFILAAVSKLARPYAFYEDLLLYQMGMPDWFLSFAAVVVPWTELLCGLALLAGVWLESALLVTFGMYVVFLICTGQAYLRGIDISCGCFNLAIIGLSDSSSIVKFVESVTFAFFRNVLLTAGVLYLTISALRKRKTAETGKVAVN